ncbi:MAG: MFS transporter [Alistipes sp.]|nr:MFS transporter [Alistipes sp.]
MKVTTGKGTIPLIALISIWSVSAVVSLPGLAISPILEELDTIFPSASKLEVEMLESLPSLMIIPFMLLAGRWSVRHSKIRLLVLGCTIFLIGGIGCTLSRTLTELIVTSTLTGIGAGIIIPLSTGLIVDYFTGNYRVKQLGISSAINNLTLVVATLAVGYLADIEWHLAFIVYLLPAITLILVPALSHTAVAPEPKEGAQLRQKTINRNVIIGLMLFYFAITYASLIVTYNTSYLVAEMGFSSTTSSVIIAIFFLAIMAPGLMLNTIIRIFGNKVNLVSLAAMTLGLLAMSLPNPTYITLLIGAILVGGGYGVMQPIIYDKAATNAPPSLSTYALSIVMVVNYLAILVAPFLLNLSAHLTSVHHASSTFIVNAVITLALMVACAFSYRTNRVFGNDD